MKKSNFDRLIIRYLTKKTSKTETAKIEAMLNARKKPIYWLSDETREFLCKKIKNINVPPKEITRIMRNLTKMRLGEVEWMRFKGIDVYFSKEAYI
jgi:hypothetical protein